MNDFEYTGEPGSDTAPTELTATAVWYPPEAKPEAVAKNLKDLEGLLSEDQIIVIKLISDNQNNMQAFDIKCTNPDFASKLGSKLGALAHQSNERFLRSTRSEHDGKNRYIDRAEALTTVSTVYAYFPKDRAVATALRAKMAALNPEKGQESSR